MMDTDCSRSRWVSLTHYIQDGRLEISNNAVENAIRSLKLGSKNWLFVGSEVLHHHTHMHVNGVEPEAYLREVLACIGAPAGGANMPTAMPLRMRASASIKIRVGRSPSRNSATRMLMAGVASNPRDVVEAGSSDELTAAAQKASAVPGMPA